MYFIWIKMKEYTLIQLEKLFNRKKDVTRLWIDRFAIIKKRIKEKNKTKIIYLLDDKTIKMIMKFKEKMDAKTGYRNQNRDIEK